MASEIPSLGAVYFRKTIPPRADWSRDHGQAAGDGHRLFRHWVPWHVVEVAPDQFDWEDYDRLLDLAAQHGIRVVLAEFVTDVPEWLVTLVPGARIESIDGRLRWSEMHVSSATGGHHVLCLDHPSVRARAENFLRVMARRYRGHPALHAYDVWNECTYYSPERLCYCEHTQDEFRRWLRRRYADDLGAVARTWKRFSLQTWADVRLPRAHAPFPDSLDALRFFTDRGLANLRWRVASLRTEDPGVLVSAHGYTRSFADLAAAGNDDYRAAREVDVWGYTYWYGTGCPPFMAGDLTRNAAAGKPFWRAEAAGNHDWFHRNRVGQPLPSHDRMHEPAEIRLDALISFASGARAYQNPRWRPQLDGPLFHAFGWYEPDGSPSARSEEIRALGEWLRQPGLEPLWRAEPVRGEVGLLLLEDAQADGFVRHGRPGFYGDAFIGAWEAWRDAGLATDVVRLPQIDAQTTLYAPMPTALADAALEKLRTWVGAGGTLIAEAPFAFFDDYAHAYPAQPNRGWSEIAGVVALESEFAPDRLECFPLHFPDGSLEASIYRQSWQPRGAAVLATHANGDAGLVSHPYGRGHVILIGGSLGWAYRQKPQPFAATWLRSLVPPPSRPWVRSLTSGIAARLWQDDSGTFLWLVNETRAALATLTHVARSAIVESAVRALRGETTPELSFAAGCAALQITVAARDAAVLRLR